MKIYIAQLKNLKYVLFLWCSPLWTFHKYYHQKIVKGIITMIRNYTENISKICKKMKDLSDLKTLGNLMNYSDWAHHSNSIIVSMKKQKVIIV
jgi:hypothetical protein